MPRSRAKAGLARSERFELPTLGIEIRCSIQLSYERKGCSDSRLATKLPPGRHPQNTDGGPFTSAALSEPTRKQPDKQESEHEQGREQRIGTDGAGGDTEIAMGEMGQPERGKCRKGKGNQQGRNFCDGHGPNMRRSGPGRNPCAALSIISVGCSLAALLAPLSSGAADTQAQPQRATRRHRSAQNPCAAGRPPSGRSPASGNRGAPARRTAASDRRDPGPEISARTRGR